VALDPDIRRRLGVGNSTGLGMAPFLVNHPALIHKWMLARETALARIRSEPCASAATIAGFEETLARACQQVDGWRTVDERQKERIAELGHDLANLSAHVANGAIAGRRPWDALFRWGEAHLSIEGQEMLVSMLMEPHGELIDELADTMVVDEGASFRIDGKMSANEMKELIERDYGWARAIDFGGKESTARFWYVSEEKLEPRLGERYVEPGAELEQPYAAGRDVVGLYRVLDDAAPDTPLADILLAHPEHRHIARRVQIVARYAYAEIRDNLIAADLVAIDLLRCKLSFFGATRFDPRSDRWVRITMFKDALFPDELGRAAADDWAFPPLHVAPA
jgi:hypothetical protein